MSIDRSTFTGNAGTSGGGAIGVENLNSGSSVTITNDTFTGNTSGAGGQGSALNLRGAGDVANCTIAGTPLRPGRSTSLVTTPVFLTNTIIANNAAPFVLRRQYFAGSHNLQFGDATRAGMTVPGPPKSLANNGGRRRRASAPQIG
jgi:hypothetical protein